MKNIDAANHTRGRSEYIDDIPVRDGCLFAVAFPSPVARGGVRRLDVEAAREADGVVCVLTAEDVPGDNQIGNILPDEQLFATGEVHYCGQPMAIVVAASEKQARAARSLIEVDIDEVPPILDPRDAASRGEFIVPPRTFVLGDTSSQWGVCAHICEGRADVGGQEHLYIETQGAYAFPAEGGSVCIHSSTQGPTAVQCTVARVLDIPMHKVIVDVARLGGAFGGKEDQATAWAVMAALAATHTGLPVKVVLHRLDDMCMTGKRHPYSADYRIGVDKDLRILAYQVSFYQNAGAACDLSPAVLERTLFHATNSYFIPHVRAIGHSCRTNLPPNTAFRGFGGPQAMFVMEAAITHAAETIGVSAREIQRRNLLKDGDSFLYGQIVDGCRAGVTWDRCEERFGLAALERDIEEFNAEHSLVKKGLALMPVCFGISFTKLHMNQARALVHVYQDGSIGVSTGAVEMGQGVNTKLLQAAARVFSVDSNRVKLETTNTTRIANSSPTAASSSSDLNGKALQAACHGVRARLLEVARAHLRVPDDVEMELVEEWVTVDGVRAELSWEQLVLASFLERVNLSEHAHYATPEIHFNPDTEKGHPFAYHVYGTAIVVARVDCLRGIYEIDAVQVVHDYGRSMNESVDRGQTEGGIVQGLGWLTMEEILFDERGRLQSDALSNYKVPDLYSAPKSIDIEPLATEGHPMALLGSKAVGEPPLMYGIGGYFAIRNAVRAFRPAAKIQFDAPLTPEKVLLALHSGKVKV